jgi:glucokinase
VGSRLAVGLDVGGTKIAGGLVDADGRIHERARCETPADDREALTEAIVSLARDLCGQAGGDVLPVGVGAAGLVDLEGAVRYAPNLPWRDYPLARLISEALDTPVTGENDANAAAWGENRAGAGTDASESMVMLTIGTGVGGGLVLDDRLVRGSGGLAAEFGHMVVNEGGPPCHCGNHGDLESMASGTAIGRTAREAIAGGTLSAGSALAMMKAEIDGEDVTAAAQEGDADAIAVLAKVGFWLGVGIGSLVNALDPQLVVIGGGGAGAGELLLGPARQAAEARVMGRAYRRLPAIVPAQLGNDAGMVGAGLLALEAADSPPDRDR